MELNKQEKQFVIKRTKLVQAWSPIGILLLITMITLNLWLFLTNPLLANPFIVILRLENDSIPPSTLVLMAGLLPVVVLICFLLIITIILFVFASFANEKKYLSILQKFINL